MNNEAEFTYLATHLTYLPTYPCLLPATDPPPPSHLPAHQPDLPFFSHKGLDLTYLPAYFLASLFACLPAYFACSSCIAYSTYNLKREREREREYMYVCMYVCMYVYVYVCIYIYICVCIMYTSLHTYVHVYKRTHLHIHPHAHTYTRNIRHIAIRCHFGTRSRCILRGSGQGSLRRSNL